MRDADRVLPPVSLLNDVHEATEYQPYRPSPWRLGTQLVADTLLMGGLIFGIPLAMAGAPFQVYALSAIVAAMFLESVLWATGGRT